MRETARYRDLQKEYLAGTVKKDKLNFWRCRNNWRRNFLQEMLWKKIATSLEQFLGASEWRMCVRSEEEKKRILESCHGGAAGGHFGRDETLEKICSRFCWRNMVGKRPYLCTVYVGLFSIFLFALAHFTDFSFVHFLQFIFALLLYAPLWILSSLWRMWGRGHFFQE